MFKKVNSFIRSPSLDGDNLVILVEELKKCGFSEFKVKLPYNKIEDISKHELSLEEFLKRDRNYAATILSCTRNDKEQIKFLFVNRSSVETNFYDDNFPSGHSMSSHIMVISEDPVQMIGLMDYFFDFVKRKYINKNEWFLIILFFLSIAFIVLQVSSLNEYRTLYFNHGNQKLLIVDIIGIITSLILIYRYFNVQRGLYIKDRNKTLSNYIDLLIRGEYKDNPLFALIIGVVGSIVATLIMNLFN